MEQTVFFIMGLVLGLLVPHIWDIITLKKEANLELFTYLFLSALALLILSQITSLDWPDLGLNAATEIMGIVLSGFFISRIINYRIHKSKKNESIEITDQILANSLNVDTIMQNFLYDYYYDEEKSLFYNENEKIGKWMTELLEVQLELRNYQYIFDNDLLKPDVRENLRWLDQCISSLRFDLDAYINADTERERSFSHRGMYLSFRNINLVIIELFKFFNREFVYNEDSVTMDYIKDFRKTTNDLLIKHNYERMQI